MPAHSLFLSRLKPTERRELEERLCARQNGLCYLCEKPIDLVLHRDSLEIDHIIPIVSSGKDEENNFALTHEICNRRKSASDLRVARIMERFGRIETAASAETGQGANLGHVLECFGGAKKPLRILTEKESIRYSIPTNDGAPIVQLPLWRDPLSGMDYFFTVLPLEYLHHDRRINPRSIGANVRGLVEEFQHKRPQLHVALAWWGPESGDEGEVRIFDGQHKAAAQIFLGVKQLPVRVFVRPDLKVLLEANTNAGDKLRQVAFPPAVKRHLGSALYYERVQEYQKLRDLSPDDYSFSESDLVKVFRGEHREVIRYIVDAVRDGITRDPNNKMIDFVEWAGKGAEKPLSYNTIEKTFYSEFLHMKPIESRIDYGLETGLNPRQLERDQMVRLMSIFAEVFFIGQWNADLGGNKLEDRVLKGEDIPPGHLRAWRIGREEILANVLEWVRLGIEHFYAMTGEMIDKDRVMHHRFPPVLWTNIENVLRNICDLPCWTDKELSRMIFGGKPPRDFWKQIFREGVSPTKVRVLAQGLDLKSLVTPKEGWKYASIDS